jgi:hypothetical protein
MSITVPFKRIGTHLFAEVDDELLLVDTGSAESFTEGRSRALAPGLRITHHRSLIVDAGELRKAVGVPALGMIGMDLLGRCDVVFDLPAGLMTLNLLPMPRPEHAHDLRTVMGVPVLNLPFHEGVGAMTSDITVFLDSGAQYTYLPALRIAAAKVGKVKDFDPILGPISACLYETASPRPPAPDRFGVPKRFAVPPRGLATLLGLAGVEGILGIDAFEQPVLMSARERWVARG